MSHQISCIKVTRKMSQTCKCALPALGFKSLVYVHYFTRRLGNVLCMVKAQFEQGNNSCDHSSSNTYFGSFLHLPQKRHYASHIYIPCNICQTFINYKLMKCSTVLWYHSNGHMEHYEFWHIFVKFNVFCIITVYLTALYLSDVTVITVTCWRYEHTTEIQMIHSSTRTKESISCEPKICPLNSFYIYTYLLYRNFLKKIIVCAFIVLIIEKKINVVLTDIAK